MNTLFRFLVTLLFPLLSFASVDVAFIEIRNFNGQLLQLEPGGRFAHVAISFQGQWLHSHPFRGVEIVSTSELQKIGRIAAIIRLSKMQPLKRSSISTFLGKPYDRKFSWTDEAIYCSELVGKILNIQPEPMEFAADAWPEEFQEYRGLPGLSPDDIYRTLKQ